MNPWARGKLKFLSNPSRGFANVVRGTIKRMKEMKPTANIMFWHASCLALLEYLIYKPL